QGPGRVLVEVLHEAVPHRFGISADGVEPLVRCACSGVGGCHSELRSGSAVRSPVLDSASRTARTMRTSAVGESAMRMGRRAGSPSALVVPGDPSVLPATRRVAHRTIQVKGYVHYKR